MANIEKLRCFEANIEKLRCFENTRDYAKLNDLMYRRRTTCMYVESCALERLQ